MTEIATQIVILAAAFLVIFAIVHNVSKARFHFIVTIKAGQPRVTKGKVPPEFLDNLRAICQEVGITAGWIGGVRSGKTTALRFSGQFPPNVQQRVRNVWFSP